MFCEKTKMCQKKLAKTCDEKNLKKKNVKLKSCEKKLRWRQKCDEKKNCNNKIYDHNLVYKKKQFVTNYYQTQELKLWQN